MARELQVSILSYDYSGYGCSTGALSVANTLADIGAAYEWLLAHGRKPGDVILYGAPAPLLLPCCSRPVHACCRSKLGHDMLARHLSCHGPHLSLPTPPVSMLSVAP